MIQAEMNQNIMEEITNIKAEILSDAQNLLDPATFSTFKRKFSELQLMVRIDEFGIWNWDFVAICLLLLIKTSESLSRKFIRYVLSLKIPLSSPFCLVVAASQTLDHANYRRVLILMFFLTVHIFDKQRQLKIWFLTLEKVFHRDFLKQWFRRLTRNRFGGNYEFFDFLIDLRSVLGDRRSFDRCREKMAEYHCKKGELSHEEQVEFLKSIAAEFFPDNGTICRKFLLCLTGGLVSFTPPRANIPPSTPPAVVQRSAAESDYNRRQNRLEGARPVALNFDSEDERLKKKQTQGKTKGQKKGGQPSGSGIVKVEEMRSEGGRAKEKEEGLTGKNERNSRKSEAEKIEERGRERKRGTSEAEKSQLDCEKVQRKGGVKTRNTSKAEKKWLDCKKVEERGGVRTKMTPEAEKRQLDCEKIEERKGVKTRKMSEA